jgi:hypothetical protein
MQIPEEGVLDFLQEKEKTVLVEMSQNIKNP